MPGDQGAPEAHFFHVNRTSQDVVVSLTRTETVVEEGTPGREWPQALMATQDEDGEKEDGGASQTSTSSEDEDEESLEDGQSPEEQAPRTVTKTRREEWHCTWTKLRQRPLYRPRRVTDASAYRDITNLWNACPESREACERVRARNETDANDGIVVNARFLEAHGTLGHSITFRPETDLICIKPNELDRMASLRDIGLSTVPTHHGFDFTLVSDVPLYLPFDVPATRVWLLDLLRKWSWTMGRLVGDDAALRETLQLWVMDPRLEAEEGFDRKEAVDLERHVFRARDRTYVEVLQSDFGVRWKSGLNDFALHMTPFDMAYRVRDGMMKWSSRAGSRNPSRTRPNIGVLGCLKDGC